MSVSGLGGNPVLRKLTTVAMAAILFVAAAAAIVAPVAPAFAETAQPTPISMQQGNGPVYDIQGELARQRDADRARGAAADQRGAAADKETQQAQRYNNCVAPIVQEIQNAGGINNLTQVRRDALRGLKESCQHRHPT